MAKGSSYEREVCKKLSLWWTHGKRDDVFWRSSNSGGRATMRGKAGKRTAGSYGDIAATDPIGKPLIDLFTIELKRGYNKCDPITLINRPDRDGIKQFEEFVIQAITAANAAGSKTWMLIHKRDKRAALCYLPAKTLARLSELRGAELPHPHGEMRVDIRLSKETIRTCRIAIVPLETFMGSILPDYIVEVLHA